MPRGTGGTQAVLGRDQVAEGQPGLPGKMQAASTMHGVAGGVLLGGHLVAGRVEQRGVQHGVVLQPHALLAHHRQHVLLCQASSEPVQISVLEGRMPVAGSGAPAWL